MYRSSDISFKICHCLSDRNPLKMPLPTISVPAFSRTIGIVGQSLSNRVLTEILAGGLGNRNV
nr:unnamed protein product [Callosobruchus analis]